MSLASRRSCHALILAPADGSAGDPAACWLRGSNNTMSPGAFEAAMQLRPVDFAL
jgi:hypothetical protein